MTDKKEIGTYILVNPQTGETYVGSGILHNRKRDHFYLLKKGTHPNQNLQEAFSRNPNFTFIKKFSGTKEEILKKEQEILDSMKDTSLCLNIAKDVRSPMKGRSHTLEVKEKITLSNIGRPGVKHTQETVDRIREANKGNSYRKGKPFTEEARKRMSETHKERMRDSTIREHLSQKLTGYKHTKEAIENMRNSRLEYCKTPEGKEKMSKMLEKANEKRSKPVIISGKRYPSIVAAAKGEGISVNAAYNRVVYSKNFPEWQFCEKEESQ